MGHISAEYPSRANNFRKAGSLTAEPLRALNVVVKHCDMRSTPFRFLDMFSRVFQDFSLFCELTDMQILATTAYDAFAIDPFFLLQL